jgi:hypothetical protein
MSHLPDLWTVVSGWCSGCFSEQKFRELQKRLRLWPGLPVAWIRQPDPTTPTA